MCHDLMNPHQLNWMQNIRILTLDVQGIASWLKLLLSLRVRNWDVFETVPIVAALLGWTSCLTACQRRTDLLVSLRAVLHLEWCFVVLNCREASTLALVSYRPKKSTVDIRNKAHTHTLMLIFIWTVHRNNAAFTRVVSHDINTFLNKKVLLLYNKS